MTYSTSGLVTINGKNINDQSQNVSRDIGLCPQHDMLFPKLTVKEQIEFFAKVLSKLH